MPLSEQQIAEGWIEHDGGMCPLSPNFQGLILKRNGRVSSRPYGDGFWISNEIAPHASDIIAYKLENPDV